MFLLLKLIFCIQAYASQYEQALKTTAQAVYIQTGYKDKVSQVTDKASKWIKVHHLVPVLTIGAIILEKRVEFQMGNFIMTGTHDKKEIDFKLGF